MSLLFIGKLCDDNCIAIFDKCHLTFYKHGQVVVKGTRNWKDGLWDVRIEPPQQKLDMIIEKDKTKHDLEESLYKCAFSPSLLTLQQAIRKGHLLT